jgi:hypothetical protein
MKTATLIFISLLLTININNFSIEDNKLEWSLVHTTDLKEKELATALKTQLQATKASENVYTAKIQDLPLDFIGVGYKKLNAPIIAQGKISGILVIQIKEGKYKATIREMMITTPLDDLSESVDDYSIKKGQYKTLFKKHLAKIMDYTFTQHTKVKKEDTDW